MLARLQQLAVVGDGWPRNLALCLPAQAFGCQDGGRLLPGQPEPCLGRRKQPSRWAISPPSTRRILPMSPPTSPPPPADSRGTRAALVFALTAERLSGWYEHGQWLTEEQGASLVADWLARTRRSLAQADRRHLSDLSDKLARQIAASLSREAGLFAAHEMMEALDARYDSELARSLMAQCETLLDGG